MFLNQKKQNKIKQKKSIEADLPKDIYFPNRRKNAIS